MNQIARINNYTVYEIENTSPEFIQRMGRFFTDRHVTRALGAPLRDSADHKWLVATDATGNVVAFSSVKFNKKGTIATFDGTYIVPELGEQPELFNRLFDLKYDLAIRAGARVVKGIANALCNWVFENRGWSIASVRGSWTHYQMALA